MKKKTILCHQDNALCHTHHIRSQRLLPVRRYQKNPEMIVKSNEEMITEAEAYFAAKDDKIIKKGIEMLD